MQACKTAELAVFIHVGRRV